jgi:hypothetical protein
MGISALEYRDLAAGHRLQADQTQLPVVRSLHLASADRLDALAEEIERCPIPARTFSRDANRLFS